MPEVRLKIPGYEPKARAPSSRLLKGWIRRSNPHLRISCKHRPNCLTRRSRLLLAHHSEPGLLLFECGDPECQNILVKVKVK